MGNGPFIIIYFDDLPIQHSDFPFKMDQIDFTYQKKYHSITISHFSQHL
jgi:hypothetical protein